MKLSWPTRDITQRTALTLIVALIGGAVATWLNMPAAMLIGAIISVSVAGIGRLKLGVPTPVLSVGFIIVGMLFGSNVAPNTLELVPLWPISLVAVIIALVVMMALSTYALHKVFGMDHTTSFLCSVPGHLSMVMALASAGTADSRKVVIVQSVRLLFLTLFVPLAAMVVGVIPEQTDHHVQIMSPLSLLILTACCVVAGLIFTRLRIPAPLVLGSMAVSVIGKISGLYEGALPVPLVAVGLLILGALIGSRMSDISLKELKNSALAGAVVTLIAVVTVSIAAWIIAMLVDMPLGQIWLGLSPGGLEAMGALGVAMGFDAAFIAAHHTWRLLLLGLAIPTMPSLLRRLDQPKHDQLLR